MTNADTLLREIADILGERPYQAKGMNGPYACVFCGHETADERQPVHDATCPWPRILNWKQRVGGLN